MSEVGGVCGSTWWLAGLTLSVTRSTGVQRWAGGRLGHALEVDRLDPARFLFSTACDRKTILQSHVPESNYL